ncbi:MAG TPA: response regulator transcription factor [candidate division Zixibacteria bacterium]|nr:response regulator transcription factor [candidate division Zixibacteria bacterium]
MTQTILIVDDDLELRKLVQSYLAEEGFRPVTASNGREALFVAREENPDLIVLDLMMPEMGGYDFIRVYGKEADIPVIILTARLEENDKILGLELGADDYVTKPFSLRELTARIRAVLRRSGTPGVETEILRADDITLDVGGRITFIEDSRVDLTPTEFTLLATFMRAPGRTFSRLELLRQVQDTAYEGYERTIDVHIRRLRTKIEPDPANPRYIETVFGFGYRLANLDRSPNRQQ